MVSMARHKRAASSDESTVVRQPAEHLYRDELSALAEHDPYPKPFGWQLSPLAVRAFILGTGRDDVAKWAGRKTKAGMVIERKFYGDDVLIDRCIVTLMGNRGLMLVGEPGTAKSMLSELLAAAVSGVSTNTIQGTAGTTEDQIKYSWNYALLLAEGPSLGALVQAPLYVGMNEGRVVRFEEITRCPPEIQDALVSVLSEKLLLVPELEGDERLLFAAPGFNVIATANTRDRGVHEMSSALKRRFNFETVHPIRELKLEVDLVKRETERLLNESHAPVTCRPEVVELLVTTFQDLREGRTAEGIQVEKPTAVMSTAEAVAVGLSAGLHTFYYSDKKLDPATIARHLAGTVMKDNPDDLKKLRHYFDTVVRKRAESGGVWNQYFKAKRALS